MQRSVRFKQARWLFGKSSAYHQEDPGSDPGKGLIILTKNELLIQIWKALIYGCIWANDCH